MIRALQLTRDFPPRSTGGLSSAVGDLAAALPGHAVDVAILSYDNWRPRTPSPARSPTGADDPAGPLIARVSSPADQPAARELARRFRPDVVHVHHEMLWADAAEIAAETGAAIVATVHVAQHRQSQLRGLSEPTASLLAQEQLLRGARAVFAPSRAAADAVLAHVPEVEPRLIAIPLGVADSAAARDAVAHPQRRDAGLILSVGRFADITGTAELWQMLAALLGERPELRAVVAGGVPENPRAERRWRERWQAIAPANVQGRVAFPGWLARAELAPLFATAAVVVSPSWFETFGLAIAEAMMFGAPVAATRSGGAEELIEDGNTGRLCPARDPIALEHVVAALIDDPGNAWRLGAGAAAFVRAHRGLDRSAGQLAAAYERTVADVR